MRRSALFLLTTALCLTSVHAQQYSSPEEQAKAKAAAREIAEQILAEQARAKAAARERDERARARFDALQAALAEIPANACQRPAYTDALRSLDEVGSVEIEYVIAPNGQTKSVSVVRGTASDLLKTITLKAMRGCQFQPAEVGGQRMQTTLSVPYVWKLDHIVPPRMVFNSCQRPEYPRDAMRREATGTTSAFVRVSTTGSATEAGLLKSSGHRDLDDAALQFLKTCTFTPGTSHGVPKELTAVADYIWKLD